MKRCRRCHRILKDAESIAAGYGPTCYKKIGGHHPATEHTKKSPSPRRSAVRDKAKHEQEPGPLFVADGLDELVRLLEEREEVD